jgi:hypothetical protein
MPSLFTYRLGSSKSEEGCFLPMSVHARYRYRQFITSVTQRPHYLAFDGQLPRRFNYLISQLERITTFFFSGTSSNLIEFTTAAVAGS